MFRKLFIGAVYLGMVTAASAQSPVDWSGIYVGANVGGSLGQGVVNHQWELINDIPNEYKALPDFSGWTAGIYAGYNAQFDGFVLGAEQDVNVGGGSGSAEFAYYNNRTGNSFPDAGTDGSVEFLWNGSTRLRAGVAFGNLLPYVTAGISYGQVHVNADPVFDTNKSGTASLLGGTVGLGLEYAVTSNVSVRGEYRYTQYAPQDVSLADGGGIDGYRVSASRNDFSVGVSFKF